ncbi:phospho-sugar mutase [Thermoflavifilum thermophilum]|uniref:Phosphoglucomutase n=1 Tax=Thermoflavifilum thermophilum TaxID=1393122 RepID=A0A1I7NMG7_9BACT|nr:phospho-sugar mutase [Thermoflavifilum thermophilum]SFV35819.1 phosphoglucomutase [Thermoflavifilum thermophilum]
MQEVSIEQRVQQWLDGPYDEETKQQIRQLQQHNPEELKDAFYRNLEFGTGGLRGIMGPGTNRMNKYTVGMATQGYANYLKQCFTAPIRVAIGHDSRNNSRFFAEITAQVMAANGIEVFLFESLRPTPELSFAIRYLKCQGGVVCTASHNPKEYNGYKAYWNDGAQLVSPHDKNVIAEVEKIQSINDVKWQGNDHLIHLIGEEIDQAYLQMVKNLSVFPEVIQRQHDLKIVYTPIHGSGIKLVPRALAQLGFTSVHIVEEQAQPDGNFPTVVYPNPEEPEAMSLGLQKAKTLDADILLGTDPDADRVGVGVKNQQGEWILLNGNQTAVLAFNYLIEARAQKKIATPQDYVVKTIVTTDMIDVIAAHYGVRCYNVLTGFKYIASIIREKEGKENYIIGGEESYGLMIGDQIRDKDAVSAVALICEMAAYEREKGRSLFDKLIDLYVQFGCYREALLSLTRKGMKGVEEIAAMMERFRNHPPKQIAGTQVVWIFDYLKQEKLNIITGEKQSIDLPLSNVLQFLMVDGSKVSARPSGTEPKIKFYFSVNQPLADAQAFASTWEALGKRIELIKQDLQLNQH